ncbi:YncE family protein [Chryseobacterium sp. SIMBA_029]|uniref:YncE family protein n=1 Tax=Chryseobacterium sp. SIMBA_029 TaxID=3085772 RepID=UPI00397BD9A5
MKLKFSPLSLIFILITLCNCQNDDHNSELPHDTAFYIDYRSLNGLPDGIAVIELDPEAPNFGSISSKLELGVGVLPHHLYYNQSANKLYSTALGGSYLYQIKTEKDKNGQPKLVNATPIDTGENTVGENLFFTNDGRYLMTFMGGAGGPKDGSIGVFNANTNQLIKTIKAPIQTNPNQFIMYPHGISVNEEKGIMMVTSTIHPDLTTGMGNTCTLLDLNTYELKETYLVADSPTDMSSPVEVLLLRGKFPQYALATTMLGGDIWIAPYNATTKKYDAFTKLFDGSTLGLGWALEMYIDDNSRLYVSFADPGKVLVFDISNLPQLKLLKTLTADKGAHHMVFFKTKKGKEVVAVQNNLLNIPNLNSGTISVIEIETGKTLGTVDLRGKYGILPESIEGTNGPSSYMHH